MTHRTPTFLAVAFGLSWLVWSLVLLDLPLGVRAWGRLRQGVLFAGGLGPFVAALVVAWLGNGGGGERGGDEERRDRHRDGDEQVGHGKRGDGATDPGDVYG